MLLILGWDSWIFLLLYVVLKVTVDLQGLILSKVFFRTKLKTSTLSEFSKTMWLSYPQKMIFKTSRWSANCDEPIKMCQPLSWAVTIFAAISSADSYFASFFILCIWQVLTHKVLHYFCWLFSSLKWWTRLFCAVFAFPNLNASGTFKRLFHHCPLLAHKLIATDIWHGSLFRHSFPLLLRVFFHMLVKQTGWWIMCLVNV